MRPSATARWAHRALLVALAVSCLGFEWEGRLSRLRREMQSPDAAQRREVVEMLSSYPAGEVGETLLGALEDPDAGVRAQAAAAVGRVRLTAAVPRLLDWLDDSEADVRAAAARALGQIGQRESVPSLVRVLGDGNSDVRRAGTEALAAIGGDEVVGPLLGRLDDIDAQVRVDAATLLGQLGDVRAVVPLVGRARDDAPEVRSAVYSALGDLSDARAVPALVQGLRDDSPEPRLAAVAALGRIGSPTAVRPLVAMLASTDARLPRSVTAALGQIDGPLAREALIDALREPRTRTMAWRALEERVQRALSAGDDAEADAVVRGLGEALEAAVDSAHASQVARALTGLSGRVSTAPATPSLLSALRDGRGEPQALLPALGSTGSEAALVPLLERLRADDIGVRLGVVGALRRYFERNPADGRAADPLLAALGNVTEPERAGLVELLGQVAATRALPTLRTLLSHRDPALRLSAIRAIGAIGDAEGAPALLDLLDEHDGRLRFEAALAVGEAASPAVVSQLLTRLYSREPTDRHALLMALARALPRLGAQGELGGDREERARRVLLGLVDSDDEALAARALDVLAAWQPEGIAEPLRQALARASTRRGQSIVQTLGALDDDVARAALRETLEGPSPTLRTQAASMIGEHGGAAEAELLVRLGPELPWPVSAAASFSLARMARRGALELDRSHDGLCAFARSHDPFVRANLAIAFAALSAPPCPGGAHPASWLDARHAEVVRAAAARWAHAADSAGHLAPASAAQALQMCASETAATELAGTCARPSMPELDSHLDVFAYGPSGDAPLRAQLVAVRLADGSAWVTRTDANGHLRLERAPTGVITLEDPAATPLEP